MQGRANQGRRKNAPACAGPTAGRECRTRPCPRTRGTSNIQHPTSNEEDRKQTPHQPSLRSYGPTGPGPLHEPDLGARVCDPQQLGLQGDVLRLTEPRSVPAARFMVPMRAKNRKEAFHEPDVHPQVFGSARTCPRFVSTRHVASRKAATCRRTPRRQPDARQRVPTR